MVSPALLCTD
ncbi:putative exported protein, partial [Yersinia pestis PY-99]